MIFRDISHETDSLYVIDRPGRFVFFFRNRSGTLRFEIGHKDSEVLIFGAFEGSGEEKHELTLEQDHVSPGAVSSCLIKSVLRDRSSLRLDASILVREGSAKSSGSFVNRNLLLGSKCFVETTPKLDIRANDVRCSHAATTSSPDDRSVAYLRLRGIAEKAARELLAEGFLEEVLSARNRYETTI